MKLSDLFEARNPSLKYTEKMVTSKLDKTLKQLDRVTVELTGTESGVMSRLTKRYERLDRSAKLLKEKRDELNIKMKDVSEDFFAAEDAVLTRVVDTVSFTVTLSKAEKGADKPKKVEIDYAAIVQELSNLLPELEEQIKAVTAKYTSVTDAADSPVKLIVKAKKVDEGIMDTLKGWVNKVFAWATGYDKKLAALKKKAGV